MALNACDGQKSWRDVLPPLQCKSHRRSKRGTDTCHKKIHLLAHTNGEEKAQKGAATQATWKNIAEQLLWLPWQEPQNAVFAGDAVRSAFYRQTISINQNLWFFSHYTRARPIRHLFFRRGSSVGVRQGVGLEREGSREGFYSPMAPPGKSTTTRSSNITESYNQTFSSDVCEKCKKYFNFHHLISHAAALAEKSRKRKELMWLIELYGHQKQDILGHLQARHWKERLVYWFIVSEIYRNTAVFVSSRNAHPLPGESVAWRAKNLAGRKTGRLCPRLLRLKLKGVLFHEQTEAVSLDYNARLCYLFTLKKWQTNSLWKRCKSYWSGSIWGTGCTLKKTLLWSRIGDITWGCTLVVLLVAMWLTGWFDMEMQVLAEGLCSAWTFF